MNEYAVRILYNDAQVAIPGEIEIGIYVLGCGECTLQEFGKVITEVLPENWMTECEGMTNPQTESGDFQFFDEVEDYAFTSLGLVAGLLLRQLTARNLKFTKLT